MIPYRSVHFVGILQPDMASLACFTASHGLRVTGSDDHEDSLLVEPLLKKKIHLFDMFSQNNISQKIDLVVVSSYYDNRHVEVSAAQKLRIPIMSSTEFIKEISQDHKRIVVFNEYEAPVIATYLQYVLQRGHFFLNALTQTVYQQTELTSLAVEKDAPWFLFPLSGFKRDASVYEANFLSIPSDIVIIPSIRYDYPEINTTLDDVYQSYYRCVKNIPRTGVVIGNSDYTRMKRLCSHLVDRHFETYGFENDAVWRIVIRSQTTDSTSFVLTKQGDSYGPFIIPYVSELMIYNTSAVVVAAILMEIKIETICEALANLPLLKRYFECFYDKEGRLIIDDQADHPETIVSVLQTIKATYPSKKIWCLYQPGSYLRTKAMAGELREALSLADIVYIADIKGYPREKSEGLHIRQLIAEFKKNHPQTYYLDEIGPMTSLLSERVTSSDCIVTLGIEGKCQKIIHPLLANESENG